MKTLEQKARYAATERVRRANMTPAEVSHVRKQVSEWKRRNPDRMRAIRKRSRRPRHYEMRETVTVELLRRDGFDCGICKTGLTGKIHIDHIVASCSGGGSSLENLRLTHASCNLKRKHTWKKAA